MSDLRKAIEELADELLDRRDRVGAGELRRSAESAYEEVARFLRKALVEHPEPEPEWEWGTGEGLLAGEPNEESARYVARQFNRKLWKRTAPGPWIEVGDEPERFMDVDDE